ncbi:MAG TPA: type II toxin-antitoxin system VapC family toxin [Candidatus Acidoferrales bacterium]|nr:type II toxin-antitoxin system VapC family toxin [Candidatus Acidoferrales bacterium]
MIRPLYLDASALVKLVADDVDELPGREAVRAYYWPHAANVYSTSYSITEALSAFKGKYVRGGIARDVYKHYIGEFLKLTIGSNLRIDEVQILSPSVRDDFARLIDTYDDIDFLDCFQLATIKHGRYSVLVGGSKPLLITADKKLAEAARKENLEAWYCVDEPAPPT